MRRVATGLLLWSLFVLAPACGGGSSSSTASIRFVQGSIDTPLVDFLVNGTTQKSNMLYGNASSYVSVTAGNSRVQVIPVNSTKPLFDQTVSLAGSANETIVLTGPLSQLKPLVLNDGSTTTGGATNMASLRVLNISTQMGPADVYLIPSGGSLQGATPVSSGLSFDQDTGYQSLNVGTGTDGADYTVYMTVPGTQSVFISTGPLTLTENKKQTVVILDGVSGGFTFTLLTDQ